MQLVQSKGLGLDPLSDVLRALRFSTTFCFRSELRAPWGVALEGSQSAAFHVVLRGRGTLKVKGMPGPIRLNAGDFVLLPRDSPHVVRDSPDSPVIPVDAVSFRWRGAGYGTARLGGKGERTETLTGCFGFAPGPWLHLLDRTPAAVLLKRVLGGKPSPLADATEHLLRQLESTGPGNDALVARLCEVVFIEAIRASLDDRHRRGDWIAGLQHEGVAAALGAIHTEPGKAWTVERLARKAAMSRSAFAATFREKVGEPPLAYLSRWRMVRATELMADRTLGMAEISERVGYASEVAFSRAFKQLLGTTPGAWRRQRANEAKPMGGANPFGLARPGST